MNKRHNNGGFIMTDNKDLITIVLPIYNVEKYLKSCLDTILVQDYDNLEVILVNDGSSDNSGKICDEYVKQYDHFSVIHKENGGLSSARNVGLKKAKGKYIIFIDSDDWIAPNMISKLYNLIINNNADISICGFNRALCKENYDKGTYSYDNKICGDILCMNNMEALNMLYDCNLMTEFVVAWNKLYNIKLFDNIVYPEGKLHEDEFTTYKLFYQSNRVVYTNEKLYYYRVTPDSIMNKRYNKNRLHILEAFNERTNFAKNINNNEFYTKTLRRYCNIAIDCYAKSKKYINDKDILQKIKKEAEEVYTEYKGTKPEINIDNIKFKAFFINYTIYRCINKFFSILR